MLNTKEIIMLLQARGYQFNRALGQHFLTDDGVIGEIIQSSGVDATSSVLEIGPGAGVMTAPLCLAAQKVLAIELDRQVLPVLEASTQGAKNLTVIREDVMKANLPALVGKHLDAPFHVVSNLPYSLTTDIILLLLQGGLPIASMTLMMQKEAALRVIAKPGGKEYGPLSIWSQYKAQVQEVIHVPPECFVPPPHVDSTVLHFAMRPYPCQVPDEQGFSRLIRIAFSMRRKTLVNNLMAGFSVPRDVAVALLQEAGLDEKVRSEQLSVEEFCSLAHSMRKSNLC